jgi:hypothetical protein
VNLALKAGWVQHHLLSQRRKHVFEGFAPHQAQLFHNPAQKLLDRFLGDRSQPRIDPLLLLKAGVGYTRLQAPTPLEE